MAYEGINKYTSFNRPEIAKPYLDYGRVALDTAQNSLREELVTLPALLKLRPMLFNWYTESTASKNGATAVFCGGNAFLINAGAVGTRLGILKHDAEPGSVATLVTQGLHYLPLDYNGDGGSPARTAANLTGLNGKIAYYVIATGTVTDVLPDSDDWDFIKIGYFRNTAYVKPVNLHSGLWYAPVYLSPDLMAANASFALPSNAGSSTFATTHYVSASISDFGSSTVSGLVQTLTCVAANADPGAPIMPGQIVWTVQGTVLTETGPEVTGTFTAGTGKTVSVSVTNGGITTTKNYTVTISATAAPASWVEV